MRVPITCAPCGPEAGEPLIEYTARSFAAGRWWRPIANAARRTLRYSSMELRTDDSASGLVRASLAAARRRAGDRRCAACSGGGTSGADKTGTAVGVSAAATATQAAVDGPPPTATDIAGFVRSGFDGLEIEYGVVNIPSFDNQDVLLGVLNDCDKGDGGRARRRRARTTGRSCWATATRWGTPSAGCTSTRRGRTSCTRTC